MKHNRETRNGTTYSQLAFDIVTKAIQWGKDNFFNILCWKYGIATNNTVNKSYYLIVNKYNIINNQYK